MEKSEIIRTLKHPIESLRMAPFWLGATGVSLSVSINGFYDLVDGKNENLLNSILPEYV